MNVYSPLKVFHFHEKLVTLSPETSEIHAPIHVRIKPTNICNHHCNYCPYQSNKELQLGADMVKKDQIPHDKMMEIVEDCIEMKVAAVTFSGGGEPFCYPHLAKSAQKLAETGIRIASLTNGGRLTGEAAEVFAQLGTWIRVSMDGWDGPSYVKFRKVNEREFQKILNNMKAFKKLGGACRLGVSYIISKDNAPHLYTMIKRIKEIGVDSIKLSPCIVSNEGKISKEYHAPIFDLVKEQALRAKEELEDSTFEVYDSYHQLEEKFNKSYQWCPFIQVLTVIGADQNVYSCQDKAYNLSSGLLGSIKEQRFKEFWFNNNQKFFIINPKKVCNHHCISNAKNLSLHQYLNVDQDHLPFV